MEFIIVVCVGALVGGLMGHAKGYLAAGILVGAVLGPLGWLLLALVPGAAPVCPMCRGRIRPGAVKCHHCGSLLGVSVPGAGFDTRVYELEKRQRGIFSEPPTS